MTVLCQRWTQPQHSQEVVSCFILSARFQKHRGKFKTMTHHVRRQGDCAAQCMLRLLVPTFRKAAEQNAGKCPLHPAYVREDAVERAEDRPGRIVGRVEFK